MKLKGIYKIENLSNKKRNLYKVYAKAKLENVPADYYLKEIMQLQSKVPLKINTMNYGDYKKIIFTFNDISEIENNLNNE